MRLRLRSSYIQHIRLINTLRSARSSRHQSSAKSSHRCPENIPLHRTNPPSPSRGRPGWGWVHVAPTQLAHSPPHALTHPRPCPPLEREGEVIAPPAINGTLICTRRGVCRLRRVVRSNQCSLFIHKSKPRLTPTVDLHLLEEHGVRAHPQTGLSVQRAIDHQRLKRFAVTGHADDLVLPALVMAITAERCCRQRRQVAHDTATEPNTRLTIVTIITNSLIYDIPRTLRHHGSYESRQ